jgi:hypothetical protein
LRSHRNESDQLAWHFANRSRRAALVYQGINYTRQKQVPDVGSIHLTAETHERIPLPPRVGGLALVGGVVLLVVGAKGK